MYIHELEYIRNLLSCVKIYGINKYRIFIEERLLIYKESYRNQKLLINRRDKIFVTYQHNVHFYNYLQNTEELT